MDGINGKSEWVQTILVRHEGDLLRYARRLTGDEGLARDVVQDTFLRLCQQDHVSLDGHLVEWLYTVCRRRAIDVKRKEQRMSLIAEETLVDLESRLPAPELPVEKADSSRQVLDFLETLPDRQQEVVRLKFQSGLRYREIAQVTGLSESHVGVLLHEALRELRRRMRLSASG